MVFKSELQYSKTVLKNPGIQILYFSTNCAKAMTRISFLLPFVLHLCFYPLISLTGIQSWNF